MSDTEGESGEPSAEAAPPEDELTDTDVEEAVAAEEPPQASGEGESGMPDAGPEDESPVEEVLIGSDVMQGSDEPMHESAPLQDDADEEGPSAA